MRNFISTLLVFSALVYAQRPLGVTGGTPPSGPGSGTVTSVTCGTGLTGGTITASGTCAVAEPLPSGTGVVQVTSSVPGLVSGTASNCVLVNGTSAACDAPGQAAVGNVTPITATNPSSVTALQQLTLTAGLLNVAGNSGGTYNYQAAGVYTVASLQTPTLTWALHGCTNSACSGGVDRTLFTIVTPAVITATSNIWIIRAKIANTTTGSSGTLFAHGTATIELTAASDLGTPSNDSNTASTAALDLTGVIYLQLYVTASSSNAGNSVVNDQSSLEPASAIGPTGPAGPSSGAVVATNPNIATNSLGAQAICALHTDTGCFNSTTDATTANCPAGTLTATCTFPTSITIPANTLGSQTSTLMFTLGSLTTATVPTTLFEVYLGSTRVFAGSAGQGIAGTKAIFVSCGISAQTVTSSAPLVFSCTGTGNPLAAISLFGANTLISNTTPAIAIDVTTSQVLKISASYSSATTGNLVWLYGMRFQP